MIFFMLNIVKKKISKILYFLFKDLSGNPPDAGVCGFSCELLFDEIYVYVGDVPVEGVLFQSSNQAIQLLNSRFKKPKNSKR